MVIPVSSPRGTNWVVGLRRVSGGMLVMALLNLTVLCVINGYSYFPDGPNLLQSRAALATSEVFPFFVLAVVSGAWSVLLMLLAPLRIYFRRRKRGRGPYIYRVTTGRALAAFITTLDYLPVLGIIGFASGFLQSGPRGGPDYSSATGQYRLNNHGSIEIVDKQQFFHAVALQNRLFSGIALAFCASSISVLVRYFQIVRQQPNPGY